MTGFKVGDRVRVADNATFNTGTRQEDTSPLTGGAVGTVMKRADDDGDLLVSTDEYREGAYVNSMFLSLVTDSDHVNHPSHYGGEDNTYEAIKVIEAWGLGFHLGNTVKYISRAGKKDPARTKEDLEKALWYLQRHIEGLDK